MKMSIEMCIKCFFFFTNLGTVLHVFVIYSILEIHFRRKIYMCVLKVGRGDFFNNQNF